MSLFLMIGTGRAGRLWWIRLLAWFRRPVLWWLWLGTLFGWLLGPCKCFVELGEGFALAGRAGRQEGEFLFPFWVPGWGCVFSPSRVACPEGITSARWCPADVWSVWLPAWLGVV